MVQKRVKGKNGDLRIRRSRLIGLVRCKDKGEGDKRGSGGPQKTRPTTFN